MGELLRIGVAEVEITPPTGYPMDGYLARSAPSTGTLDPLMAQVLVIALGARRAAIVTLDLLAVTTGFTGPLRTKIAALLDTTPAAVLVAASHTHAGPAGMQDWFPVGQDTRLNPALVEAIESRIVSAAQSAASQLQPATLASASGDVVGIGGDRNQPDQPVDTRVTAVRFNADDGRLLAALFHYACHPTVLSAANTRYSADFVGAARQRIQAAYPGSISLYLNGAAGNISTRFLRRDQSDAEVAHLGGLLGDRVLELLATAQPDTARQNWACTAVRLPLRAYADEARTLAATGVERFDTVRAEGLAIEADLQRAFAGWNHVNAEVCGLCVGPWALLTIPGEAFSELALQLRAEHPNALVVGYANDYLGYFPTQRAIDDATYEALSSPYDARAHEYLRASLAQLLGRLRADEP